MKKLAIFLFHLTAVLIGICETANATCGTKGGPGYRAPDGHCVFWMEIRTACGCPPSTRCTPENVASGADAAACNQNSSINDTAQERRVHLFWIRQNPSGKGSSLASE